MSKDNQKLNKKHFIAGGIVLIISIFWIIFTFTNKPLTYNDLLKKAETYAEKGQIAFALEEYNKLLSLYPENYDIHVSLADLYKKINEIDKAKIEYIMAIRLGKKYKTEAYIKLAQIYCEEKKFNIVKDVIQDIKETTNKEAQEELGNIYFSWAEHISDTDKPEAIRKFREARDYYKKTKSKSEKKVLKKIIQLYADISDELLAAEQPKKAAKILKLAIDYEDNALAHYKLAQIYEKHFSEDDALKQYSETFKLDPEFANQGSYINLLLKKAGELREKGDKVTSEYYYKKAKKMDNGLDIPLNPDKRILFTLIETRVNEDMDNDLLVPGIKFKLINISKYIIENVKVKIVFLKNDKPFSTQVITITENDKPFKGDSETPEISIYSNSPIKHIFDDHNITVQVYITQGSSEKWKLFRNIDVERKRKPVRLVK